MQSLKPHWLQTWQVCTPLTRWNKRLPSTWKGIKYVPWWKWYQLKLILIDRPFEAMWGAWKGVSRTNRPLTLLSVFELCLTWLFKIPWQREWMSGDVSGIGMSIKINKPYTQLLVWVIALKGGKIINFSSECLHTVQDLSKALFTASDAHLVWNKQEEVVNQLNCMHTHTHNTEALVGCKRVKWFSACVWKVLTPANISWCVPFICILGAASAGSYCHSVPFECQRYYYSGWCNSRCLSARLSRILCPSLRASAPRSAPAALLRWLLFNSYHYVPAKWNPLFPPSLSISIFLGSRSTPLRPLTLIVMAETEKAPYYCCLASLLLLCTAKTLTGVLLTRSGGNGPSDISQAEMWQHKHCSLLPWQRRTKIPPSSRDFPTHLSAMKAECSFLRPYCLLVFTLNQPSCQHRSDCIFCSGFIDAERRRK